MSDSKTLLVPETILKARKRREENRNKALERHIVERKENRLKRYEMFRRAESYMAEYVAAAKDEARLAKVAQDAGNFYVPPESKIAVVIRIRGIVGIHPKPRKVMQLLRLRQINNAVFIKVNKSTMNMLKLAEPYLTWGYPTLQTVREMIYKRGYMKVNKQRKPINDNAVIEDKLGKHGVICVEDMIHEIYTCGPKFQKVTNAMWHFKLTNPKGGWRKIKNHFVDGGDFGNREDLINPLVHKMC